MLNQSDPDIRIARDTDISRVEGAFVNQRPRECTLSSQFGTNEFVFTHGKKRWEPLTLYLRTTRLPARLLLAHSGIVPVGIYHAAQQIDAGYFEIDHAEEVLVPREFDHCFARYIGKGLDAITPPLLSLNDRMSLLVDNGFYTRAGELMDIPGSGITHLHSSYHVH